MECGEIHPNATAISNKTNKTSDKAIRHVNALTVRSERPLSAIKKYKALPNEKKIPSRNNTMIVLMMKAIFNTHYLSCESSRWR